MNEAPLSERIRKWWLEDWGPKDGDIVDQFVDEVAAREQERNEAIQMCRQSVDTGMAQAEEWDRFWQAMGVASEDITVDEAIAKYRAERAELARLREALDMVTQTAKNRLDEIHRLREAVWEGIDNLDYAIANGNALKYEYWRNRLARALADSKGEQE